MISRTVKTLEQRCRDLKDLTKDTEFKDCKYEFISSDFSKGTTIEFYDDLIKQFGDKDISIVINNVGNRVGSMEATPKDDMINSCILNIFPNAMMIRKFISKMDQRKHRSAVVSLSSMNSLVPLGGRSLYSACKKFSLMLSNNVIDSEGDNIDFFCLKPAYVATPMNDFRKLDMFTTDLDTCASSALKCLGNIGESYGAGKHVVLGFVIGGLLWLVPDTIVKKLKSWLAYKVLKTTDPNAKKADLKKKTK